jgi:predicted acylesterase/phospholipase RssA
MEKMQHFNIVAMIQGRGASSFSNIQEHLEKMTIAKIGYLPTLNDLKEKLQKTLVCATYNLTENRTEYLSYDTHPNLPCITALRMSSNLPLIFETYRYGNSLYVDGAISDNFPIDIGEKMGEKVLGIVLNTYGNHLNHDPETNVLEFVYRLISINVGQLIKYKIEKSSNKCKIINITDAYSTIKVFEFNVDSSIKLDMFSHGYNFMKACF